MPAYDALGLAETTDAIKRSHRSENVIAHARFSFRPAGTKPIYRSLYIQVLIAILLGVAIGWLWPSFATNDWVKASCRSPPHQADQDGDPAGGDPQVAVGGFLLSAIRGKWAGWA